MTDQQQPLVKEEKEEKKEAKEKKEEKKDIVEEAVAMTEEEFEAEVKEATEDMKEWQREREQEYLRRVGFEERKREDKVQFIKRIENGIIGRTYNDKYPNGWFWGFRGDNKNPMSDKELKEIEDIQKFYAFRKGKIQMPELPAVRREVTEKAFERKGGVYKVGGHEEPDAWLVQQWANQAGVSTEVREAIQTDEQAKATVRAYMGAQFVDATVIHQFTISRELIAFEIVEKMEKDGKKAIEGYDEEGRPILTQEAKYRIYKRFMHFRNFAIRDAISKAARIAQLKILNKEWREEEEIEAEASEVKMVHEEGR